MMEIWRQCLNGEMETHLLNDGWETILDKDIRRMIVASITGAARKR